LGLDYDDRVLPSITNEVLKAVVAQFDAGELITQREMVKPHDNTTCSVVEIGRNRYFYFVVLQYGLTKKNSEN
jgi:hypothetical protein